MDDTLYVVLQAMCRSGFEIQCDALVHTCRRFCNDPLLAVPVSKYRFLGRHGRTRLYAACGAGALWRVRFLLDCGVYAGADCTGHLPIVAAASKGHTDVVRLLLGAAGVDANAVDPATRYPALHAAAHYGHVEVVRLLCSPAWRSVVDIHKLVAMDQGASVTALHAVRGVNGPAILRLLLDAGADVNASDGRSGYTPLHMAIASCSLDMVEAMCAHEKVDLNRVSAEGAALHVACSMHVDGSPVLRMLLQYCSGPSPRCDVNVRDRQGRTPLLKACAALRVKAVELLLEIPHVDVWAVDRLGNSAWTLASQCSRPLDEERSMAEAEDDDEERSMAEAETHSVYSNRTYKMESEQNTVKLRDTIRVKIG